MDRYLNANIILSKFCVSFAKLKKDLPIRPSEMGVLNIIVQRDGLFTPLMIAELLEVSKPMITAHISVLEKKGYIYKEYSKQDGRSCFVSYLHPKLYCLLLELLIILSSCSHFFVLLYSITAKKSLTNSLQLCII